MKKFTMILMIFFTAVCFTQTKSDYTGIWEIIVKRSGFKNYPSPKQFVEFMEDGTYIWGIDSLNSDPLQSVSKGTWEISDDGLLKLVPSNNSVNEINYYRKSGDDRLSWNSREINGIKENVMLEMSLYLERRK